ncbi:bifunctional 4-hydroxy-2-oxoglutarate aldolase/2-dehydro-3-deoxy-phosphogluconate aldolase [Henriciella mobilis]|uniref:bifunctional 4-hydroxy-2-oxoglutarate aldolase/2-dehydro-3-deoxy-phosphogluconate aldolase n=1 Tax=Henriciella mobilis TaxID=2305467 RepID=UPI000E6650B3|nr:bifunctional 4-hydroxy-2-oxoglutarate aldolase/2-dehydro-3-deoxy-phosphogluconate aldolase [Henriciella mobilis]RIJ16074.1 bifunctional 4-hydroxy-2-oxoglutarate aldolase/2-dehydro-3-deoxy-phosphogluconate aldolase [Henriciella mobilis]RIJ23014.1 bifunctional 4-hydroxy-2-oxoglutarate aldolase/2-dehydro-3-deoxy-phosphogluconate aldolase [Henriciella mobilis]
MKTMTAFRAAIEKAPIVPVLTVYEADHAEPLAEALAKGGLTAVEVTLRTPAALDVIRIMGEAQPDLLVGAGTIISEGDVDAALKAGSDFLVTPGTSPLLLDALGNHDGVILPGVSTTSEAMARFDEGYGVMKFFPAEAAGGANFLKSLSGPLPHMDFMPTGGITPRNAGDYLSLPNVIAVGGSWLATKDEMAKGDWAAIVEKAKDAVRIGRGA